MDVERTIQSILESQLRAAERADRADVRADRADKRMDRFDKQLGVTVNLVRAEVKMVQEMRKETDFKLNALMDSQMRTEEQMRKHDQSIRRIDEKFNRLLDILNRKHPNGRK